MKNIFKKLCDCFFLLRIPLLVPVWTVLILGWIAGNSEAIPGGWIFRKELQFESEYILWLSLIAFSFIVASIYVVNQIVDIESDRINHKLFILPNGLISIKTAWICSIVCAIFGIVLSLLFLDKVMITLFAASLILGALYNLPPVCFKNRAWGGVIANFLGHGVITFLVGWHAAGFGRELNIAVLKTGLIASMTAGFANAAVFITTTIPDADGDKVTGKKTFCVMYGEKNTAVAGAIACALALVFSFTLEFNKWVMFIPSLLSLVIFISFVVSTKKESAFKTFRWPVYLLSTFVVVFIPVYGIVVIITLIGSRLYYKIRFNFEYPTFKCK